MKLFKQCRQDILPERRVEENHVEAFAFTCEIADCIATDDLHLVGAERGAVALELGQRDAILFDHHHAARAARSRLKAERAAAGVKIQAGESLERLSERVEQGFAHAIGRRAQPGPRGHAQQATAILAADYPQGARAGTAIAFVRMHASMLAATSWAARLKAGLARTREALGTDVGVLLGRRKLDDGLFDELEGALLSADCGVDATRALLDDLRGRAKKQRIEDGAALKTALKAALLERLAPLERAFDTGAHKPCVVVVAGVNGSGKTTSIGKLAKWLQARGARVLLAAGDTFRAAAREQLAAWGERNGVPVIGQQGGDPGAVVFDAAGAARARDIDVLIADTAGRLPTQLHLMEEIKKVKRVIAKAMPGAPHETLLVLDGGTGQNAIAQVKAFDDALGLT